MGKRMARNTQLIADNAAEDQGESALRSVMREARAEVLKRNAQAQEHHVERLKSAIREGVARRLDVARDW